MVSGLHSSAICQDRTGATELVTCTGSVGIKAQAVRASGTGRQHVCWCRERYCQAQSLSAHPHVAMCQRADALWDRWCTLQVLLAKHVLDLQQAAAMLRACLHIYSISLCLC